MVVVARFLALLELFREAAVVFDQPEALGELTVEWVGSDEGSIDVGEFDDPGDAGDGPDDGAGAERRAAVEAAGRASATPVSRVGSATASTGLVVVDGRGVPLDALPRAFDHFAPAAR